VKALIYIDGESSIFSEANKIKQLKIILNALNNDLSGNSNIKKSDIKKAS
jgi:hypothetical protein